ncbi:MAG: hypothetical protein RBR34_05675 [Rhodospirillaceae bacterium]|nr:hypothetical protein [Rhodospirillaceae bacterium]
MTIRISPSPGYRPGEQEQIAEFVRQHGVTRVEVPPEVEPASFRKGINGLFLANSAKKQKRRQKRMAAE